MRTLRRVYRWNAMQWLHQKHRVYSFPLDVVAAIFLIILLIKDIYWIEYVSILFGSLWIYINYRRFTLEFALICEKCFKLPNAEWEFVVLFMKKISKICTTIKIFNKYIPTVQVPIKRSIKRNSTNFYIYIQFYSNAAKLFIFNSKCIICLLCYFFFF